MKNISPEVNSLKKLLLQNHAVALHFGIFEVLTLRLVQNSQSY